MVWRGKSALKKLVVIFLIVLTPSLLFNFTQPTQVLAATLLGDRYDMISNSRAGVTATHEMGITMTDTAQAVGSISFEFCSNDPIPNTACTVPVGFDASTAVLSSQTGDTGFSIHANSTVNRIILTRVPGNPSAALSTYTFDGITNPSSDGSYYVRVQTYGSDDATGIDIQNGGLVFAIVTSIDVSAEVPPFLRFCVAVTIVSFDCSTATSYFIDFGFLNSNQPSVATSQFVAATNAVSGYSVTITGTTMQSGTNAIPPLATPSASIPGTSQFGLNAVANISPSVGSNPVGPGTALASPGYNASNQFSYVNNDVIAAVTHSDDNRKFTVSYLTNISTAQPPGVYSTTISFICLGNF